VESIVVQVNGKQLNDNRIVVDLAHSTLYLGDQMTDLKLNISAHVAAGVL
jgi:hypothetical protein